MSNLYIYGASDDLVEVEGLVRDEFNHYDEPAFVTVKVDDAVYATVMIQFDHDRDGEWRILSTSSHDGPAVTIIPARHEDDGVNDEHGCPGYSDKAVVDMGEIEARRVVVSSEAVA